MKALLALVAAFAALALSVPAAFASHGYDPRAYVPGSAPHAVAASIQRLGYGRQPSVSQPSRRSHRTSAVDVHQAGTIVPAGKMQAT
jgi:hypothetical protein